MNVFEDLITELREENLLERTVIDDDDADTDGVEFDQSALSDISHDISDDNELEPDAAETTLDPTIFLEEAEETEVAEETEETEEAGEAEAEEAEEAEESEEAEDGEVSDLEPSDTHAVELVEVAAEEAEPEQRSAKGRESFKKRAVTEVSSLQMVEHVLTGVEREYMKIVPSAYDDLSAKRALHVFLNIVEDADSEEHSSAEFKLMQETEAWCTALGTRDRDIPVSSLRLYCENSRPALSSQALVGLARFYRNLPYSENVRAKFDFTITRLFSRAVDKEKRVCLFTRPETLTHINTLYKEWSSVPLYSAEDDESKVTLTALSFEDLAAEAEIAASFDVLIESDFFGRLRLFKESISELFFAPNVTAAAIECNIRIGNAYVDLIDLERRKMDDASIQSKYGDVHDEAVSDAAARTLGLVELLRDRSSADVAGAEAEDEIESVPAAPPAPPAVSRQRPQKPKPAKKGPAFLARLTENALSVNKWFLAAAIILISISVGLWIWANFVITDDTLTAGVDVVNLDNSVLKDHIKTARLSGGTLYGLLGPTWDALPKEKRQEFLQKVLQAGKEKGYTQVNLISKDGKVIGHASPTRLDVSMQ